MCEKCSLDFKDCKYIEILENFFGEEIYYCNLDNKMKRVVIEHDCKNCFIYKENKKLTPYLINDEK